MHVGTDAVVPGDLRQLFGPAQPETVTISAVYGGFSQKDERRIVLGVEVRTGNSFQTHIVKLGARNFGYVPDSIVARGNSVTIEFTNDGVSAHTFTVDNKDLDVVVQPGQTKTIHVSAGSSNFVDFYCRFHVNYGMRGTIAFNR